MSESARDKAGHRWSGWPGAFCFYCLNEDPRESCLADGHDAEHCKLPECQVKKCPVPDVVKSTVDRKMNEPRVQK